MNTQDFATTFRKLTGFPPFHWQRRLWEQLAGNPPHRWPTVVDIPTGLGKTHVIAVWWCAWLAAKQNDQAAPFPRRLVYVVNRRTVVDQSTEVVRELVRALERHGQDPPTVSTLRGELADDGGWKRDPSRPAVIVGTVDMIGSKLLFCGYGDSHRTRPLHAGLIGQDALVVHDEAHLTRPFGKLLRRIACQQAQDRETRPIRIMELSATSVDAEPDPARVLRLALEAAPNDEQRREAEKRVNAPKRLRLHVPNGQTTPTVDRLFDLAKQHAKSDPPVRVLVFVQSPKDVEALRKKLTAESAGAAQVADAEHVAVLTGTLRGKERDELVAADPVYRWFLGGQPLGATAYLVSTSAGEVGVDFDADHLVCDLTTLEGMIQRLGRVNRRGGRSDNDPSLVDVAVESWQADPSADPPKKSDTDRVRRLQATYAALCDLPEDQGERDASPGALRRLADVRGAWSAEPASPPLTDILLDAWSLTSLSRSSATGYPPPVAAWLHGLADELPDTHVAWRWDLGDIRSAESDARGAQLNEVMRRFPLRSHEQLRDRTDRVQVHLTEIVKRLDAHRDQDGTSAAHHLDAAIRVGGGDWAWVVLRDLAGADFSLKYATVVLPVEAGGLDGGLLDGKHPPPENAGSLDVAEYLPGVPGAPAVARQRVKHRGAPGEREPVDRRLYRAFRLTLTDPEQSEDGVGSYLDYFVPRGDPDAGPDGNIGMPGQVLDDHARATERHARHIARSLALPEPQADALNLAARLHDAGKSTPIWQRVACGRDESAADAPALARSPEGWFFNGRALQGFRHEFASLIRAEDELRDHPERDLILHLIAAHHGWARPHFRPVAGQAELGSTAEQEAAIHEAMRRFARLQQGFGRWGLAWLESLLRCADALGSQESPDPQGDAP